MIELLAPAGTPEALNAAIHEGADAVYLGLKSFNARMRSANFSWGQFEASVETLHRMGRRIYVTVNTLLTEAEAERMYRFLAFLNDVGPDGIIVQDFGVAQMAHRYFPQLKLHASTQMNIGSAQASYLLSKMGVSRIVLPRETTLPEIEQLHARTSCELEVFVHGAVCVAESGLCLFSSFLGGKSANRGMCTQACRRLYTAHTPAGDESGYFFSPHDLQLIEYMPQLIEAGVVSFKIEGRMKSAEYVGTVVAAYREVLDAQNGDRQKALHNAKRLLKGDFARKKTSFWIGEKTASQVLNPNQAGGTGLFLGVVAQVRPSTQNTETEEMLHNVRLKNSSSDYELQQGDSIRLHAKKDTHRKSFKIRNIEKINDTVWFDIPQQFGLGDSVYLLQTKAMSKRYPDILPRSLSAYRRQPGDGHLPPIEFPLTHNRKTLHRSFPEGLYVQVSRIRDAQALREHPPAGLIINLNEETQDDFIGAGHSLGLPVKKHAVWISLDPFFPQSAEQSLTEIIDLLIADGYKQFILNNPGHISLLKNRDAVMMAGPYVYSFNRYAANWLFENDLEYLCSAHENSQDNLEATIDTDTRNRVLVPIFSYPPLFRMRLKLPQDYNFTYFSDKSGESFRAFSTSSASFVLPDKPFAIFDRIPNLKKKGFTRFLLDYSHTVITPREYRHIWQYYTRNQNPADVSRFNWKEGFYDPVRVEALKQHSARQQSTAKKNKQNNKSKKAAQKNSR